MSLAYKKSSQSWPVDREEGAPKLLAHCHVTVIGGITQRVDASLRFPIIRSEDLVLGREVART